MRDLYEVMELKRNATDEDIRKAYKRLARKYHPDVNPGDDEATEKFKEMQSAYEILGDSQKKAEYDRFGSVGSRRSQPRGSSGPFNSSFDDFFGDVFGKRSRKMRGEHIMVQCPIDLDDVFNGKKQVMEYTRNVICKDCNGVGGELEKCSECEGRGVRIIRGRNMNVQVSCEKCGGKGQSICKECTGCGGHGISGQEKMEYEFEIPKGAETGMRFAFRGLGQPCPQGDNGDLFIVVVVKEHDIFKRLKDGGVLCEVPVSFTQLVLGAEIDVPTIDKEMVSFKIPKGTQANTKFRFKDKGLPKFNNGESIYRGDQFIQVKLEIPTNVEGRYKELIEELATLEQPNGDESNGKSA